MPALAIPVQAKQDFECPEEHLKCLRDHLSRVSKMIVIGWRAAELHFLEMLAAYLPRKKIPVCLVCGSGKEEEGTADRLQASNILIERMALNVGFTQFTEENHAERYLAH
jgi:hypothetical protein